MDEPTTYLDMVHQIRLIEMVRRLANEGKAVVMVLHDLAQALIIGTRTKDEAGKGCPGYKICIGGRWGKKTAQGQPLSKIFTSEEEVLDTIEKIILFYKDNGLEKERFAETIARIGFEEVEKQILN